jgi:hypothetical protein
VMHLERSRTSSVAPVFPLQRHEEETEAYP